MNFSLRENMRARRFLAPLLLGALPALRASAQAPAFTPEGVVNGYTTGNQIYPRVAGGDANGDFVIAWESYGQDGSGYGVFGQFFPGLGLLPPQFQASSITTGDQYRPDVATDASGNFVVVWNSPYLFSGAIYGQLFDNTGSPVGSEFSVDVSPIGTFDEVPRVGMAGASGHFAVVWDSNASDGDGIGISGQRFDAAANPLGGHFQVNTYTTGNQRYPSIGADPYGDFVVVWQSAGQDGSGYGVFAQRYDSLGNTVGGEFQVNTYTTGNQAYPSVAMAGNGDFVVVWVSDGQDGDHTGIFGQLFDPSGNRIHGEFRVNTNTTSYQQSPAVAMGPFGDFLVAWTTDAFDPSGDIAGQSFDAGGRPRGTEFTINSHTTGAQGFPSVAFTGAVSGDVAVCWQSDGEDGSQGGVVSRLLLTGATPALAVDQQTVSGSSSNQNGVLEAGETVQVAPAWTNPGTIPILGFAGAASNFTGPAGPVYAIDDASANYGNVNPGATHNCKDLASDDCYLVTVAGTRPASHWDATLLETVIGSVTKTWTLHVGQSFPDVATSNLFYAYIENIFHNGVTGGCGGGDYCPTTSVTRAQMAVFLLKAARGATFVPPPCSGVFGDVTCPSLFADWIEELAAEGITGGCGGGNYCPSNPVTRAQMAAFLLKAEHGSSYTPPACTGMFGDVPCPSLFADWIEQLSVEGITGGCGGGNYCPNNPNTRGQMAVFLVKTFGLLLYGP